MEEKICSFFGHREFTPTEKSASLIKSEILKAIEYGCNTFYFGGYGEFDRFCYNTVSAIKSDNPNLKRVYCVADEKYIRKRVRYFNPDDYDEIIFLNLSFDWWYKAIYYRNCAMIDKSDYIIFFAEERQTSGAYKAYKYALSKKKEKIVNLYTSVSS